MTLRLGSLCTGYGGLDLAAEHLLGPLQHTWHAEIDPHASKVLAHHWPATPNLGDLTAVDWTRVPPVDVLTAGFPCQDVSCAGKRAGLVADRWEMPAGEDIEEMPCGCFPMNHKVWCEQMSPLGWAPADGQTEDDQVAAATALNERDRADHPEWLVEGNRTGVWSYIVAAIKHLRPKLVLLENVRGLLSARADSDVEPCPWCLGDISDEPVVRALGAVLADLADLGFDAEWTTVAAADVGAPHRRERVFIAAWPADAPRPGLEGGREGRPGGTAGRDGGDLSGRVGVAGAAADGVTLLPTPRTNDMRGPGVRGDGGLDLRTAISLMPTPAAARSGRQRSASAGAAIRPSLDSITALLPTPTAKCAEDSQTHRSGARSDELLLTGVAKAWAAGALLPTPTVADSRGSRNATAGRTAMKPTTSLGWTLSDIAYAGVLLPTPMAADGGSDRASSAGFGLRDTSRKIPDQWGPYAPAIARWEAVTDRPAPSPTEPGAKGQPRLAPPFVEWLMGLPAGWVTEHLGRGQALKCLGNGVVWQQAAHAYTELLTTAA